MARAFVASALNSAGTATPSYYKDITFTGCAVGDLLVVGGVASGCVTGGTARNIQTTAGSTGSWTQTSTSPTGTNADTHAGHAEVTGAGDVTVRVNVRMPAGEYMAVCGWRIPNGEWTGTPAFTSATADANDAISVTVGQSNSLVLYMMGDYNGVSPGTTNTPSGGTNDASYSGTFYATAWRSWYNQASGTRDYGPSGPSGCAAGVIVCVVDQGAAYPEPITLRAAGTATSATAAVTAVNPAVPAGATTGDLSHLTVWAKPYSTAITTPSGWTKIGEATNGTTASGTDTGSTKVAVYVLESASVGAIGNITQSGADSMGAVINTYAKDATKSWDVSAFTAGGDSANGANYSATGAAGISVAADDWVLQSTAVNGDVGTPSAFAIGGMSGATLGTYVSRQSAAVTTGNDTRGVVGDIPVTAGSSSSAPTFTYTNASSGSGTTMWLRLRQVVSGTNAPAENVALAVAANDATATVAGTAEAAAPAVAAFDATVSTSAATNVSAEAAGLSVSALDATVTASGNAAAEAASAAAAALDATTTSSGSAPPEAAAVSVSALDATVSTASATNAQAEVASASVAAESPAAAVAAPVEVAAAAATALDATVSTQTATNAAAEVASGAVAVPGAVAGVSARPDSAGAAAAALDATVQTTAAGQANAEAASGSATALDATVKVGAAAESAAASTAAQSATVQTGTSAAAGVAEATAASADAGGRVSAGAEVADVTVATQQVTVGEPVVALYLLRPPTVRERPAGQRYTLLQGVSLIVTGGVVEERRYVSQTAFDTADYVYLGGHDHVVDQGQADVLIGAGYSECLTPTM